MSDEDARRLYSIDESRRASHDADELAEHLGRALPGSFSAQAVRVLAEQLVTEAWTRIGPGEQVTCRPTPRIEELSLRDQLAATIAGRGDVPAEPVALAEYLVGDGWVKLGPNEKVVTPMSADEATQLVAAAFQTWETLKAEAAKRPAVSADSSELTATVKLQPESLILAAFIGADRPLTCVDACDAAAGNPVRLFPDGPWHRWNAAFRSLEDRKLIEALPAVPGEVKRYQLTEAGRGLHELDGIDP